MRSEKNTLSVLFITIAWPNNHDYNIYSDLMDEFVSHGHKVTVVTITSERKKKLKPHLTKEKQIEIIKVKSGSIQKSNRYKKVIVSFLSGIQILMACLKCLKGKKYDLILFSTPPITLTPSLIVIKKLFGGKLYLLLKDIWPQDSVDLGVIKKGGLVWKVFRWLERLTYLNSDYIGCMSPANVTYIRKENPYLKNKIIEVCPNSLMPRQLKENDIIAIRKKYDLPEEKVIVIYGGNLGKPQGVYFLADILRAYMKEEGIFFLILGGGTEYDNLKDSVEGRNGEHQVLNVVRILPMVSSNDFIEIASACDIGLILLDKNSTVPNFPSKLLNYLILKLPVIAATDRVTDLGTILEQYSCGLQVDHGNLESFQLALQKLVDLGEGRKQMGENGYKLYLEKYTTKESYQVIINHYL